MSIVSFFVNAVLLATVAIAATVARSTDCWPYI